MKIACICAFALLAACTSKDDPNKFVEDEKSEAAAAKPDTRPLVLGWKDARNGKYLDVIVDDETGCEYVAYSGHGYNSGKALTPRMNSKGVQVCKNLR